MSSELVFAIDKNLGFDADAPVWRSFFSKFNVKVVAYDDMEKLTEDMEKHKITCSYLPSANYFYFMSDNYYVPIANALFAANQTSESSSVLVVSKASLINTLSELKGKRFGFIHPYCTSSFFAAALLLWKHNFSIHDFFSTMRKVGPWQLQVDAVIAKEVDATMVPEDIWYKQPKNTEKTKIIAREKNLPSPIVVCSKNADKTFVQELKELLLSYKPKASPNALFNGFIPYQKDQEEAFFSESTQAFSSEVAKV
ncbi:MAG: PhnD/SsuA/transferrin family substrate-binding protein [Chlamydiales bacterium]|nr:PhnD/SsuA/transferrin family substrate-binding protein [Chlamydiales bacterium]